MAFGKTPKGLQIKKSRVGRVLVMRTFREKSVIAEKVAQFRSMKAAHRFIAKAVN